MGSKFAVQIKSTDKWQTVYQGEDENKAHAAWQASIRDLDESRVRALRSDGLKADGKAKWTLHEFDIQYSDIALDEDCEPSLEDKVQDWEDRMLDRWDAIPSSTIGTIALFLVFAWLGYSSLNDEGTGTTTEEETAATISARSAGTRLTSLENHLQSFVQAGGELNMNNLASAQQSMAYMEIIMAQMEDGFVGSEVQKLTPSTIKSGHVMYNGRRLRAGLVQVDAQLVNRNLGKYLSACVRMAGIVDQEFNMARGITFLACNDNTSFESWASRQNFTQ